MELDIGGYKVLIDDEDYEKIKNLSLSIHKNNNGTPYVRVTVPLHRFLMQGEKHKVIDHKDGDSLNNCKANLRICSEDDNRHNRGVQRNNTTGYKGVSFNKRRNKYQANIGHNKRIIYLGSFDNPKDAHRAYCEAAKKYHGEYACFG